MRNQRGYTELLESRGVSLDGLGLRERALPRAEALRCVDVLEEAAVPILGGDVVLDNHGSISSAYANWYSERRDAETDEQFVTRSCAESRAYISKYPEMTGAVLLFVLVPRNDET